MAILKYIFSLLLAIITSSCYKEFDPEIDENPVLCLNAMITSGEPLDIQVTHTWTFGKNGDNNVTDATVSIIANGATVDGAYIPKDGDKIQIIANSTKYGKATAEVTVPFAVPAEKIEVTPIMPNTTNKNDNSKQPTGYDIKNFDLNIRLTIKDPSEYINLYHFDYKPFCNSKVDNSFDELEESDLPIFSIGTFNYKSEPIFEEHIGTFETITGNDDDNPFLFFTDRQFSGKEYTLRLNFLNN